MQEDIDRILREGRRAPHNDAKTPSNVDHVEDDAEVKKTFLKNAIRPRRRSAASNVDHVVVDHPRSGVVYNLGPV